LTHQSNQLAVIFDRQPTGAACFEPVSQPLNAFRIEAVQATSHRLRTAVQSPRNGFDLFAIPTPYDHLRMQNPIGWSMPTRRHFPDLPLFAFILRCSRLQDLGHLLAPFCESLLLSDSITTSRTQH
jgi:hypothetical protein